jgi:hypothetical protein
VAVDTNLKCRWPGVVAEVSFRSHALTGLRLLFARVVTRRVVRGAVPTLDRIFNGTSDKRQAKEDSHALSMPQ